MSEKRIVSLIASSTEMVCALGFEKELVGRSHECDYPESIKGLPACTEPNFVMEGSSGEIDMRVKETLKKDVPVYKVDAEMLQKLRPTHIFTQDQCEVCAVSLDEVKNVVCNRLDSKPEIISLAPNSIVDIWLDIAKVAQTLGVSEKGKELIQKLKGRVDAIAKQAAEAASKPAVACIEWIEPVMAAGNWVPELVALAGGHNLFGEAGKHSPWMKWDQLRAKNPDVLVIMPCGFDMKRTKQEMILLEQMEGWDDLKAVRNEKVYLTDGNQYFNRPGPRLVESLEILAEILHPEIFQFGHEGSGWEKWTSAKV